MRQELFVSGPQGKLWISASGVNEPRSRRTIVLAHADCGTSDQWDELRERLEPRFATVAFDRRGHGRSDPPRNGDFSVRSSGADIEAIADHLGIEKFALIGHSGGALTAWSFAVRQSRRVAGLLLVDPPLDASVLSQELVEQTLEAMRGPDLSAGCRRLLPVNCWGQSRSG